MAGLLSNLGGIDPHLFNKPTMGQLKSKQPPPAVPKTATPAVKSDTIAAVGSPVRPDASASESFSSRKPAAARAPEHQAGHCPNLSLRCMCVQYCHVHVCLCLLVVCR